MGFFLLMKPNLRHPRADREFPKAHNLLPRKFPGEKKRIKQPKNKTPADKNNLIRKKDDGSADRLPIRKKAERGGKQSVNADFPAVDVEKPQRHCQRGDQAKRHVLRE